MSRFTTIRDVAEHLRTLEPGFDCLSDASLFWFIRTHRQNPYESITQTELDTMYHAIIAELMREV